MSNVLLTQNFSQKLVTFQGFAADVEATLDTLVYIPPRNMSALAAAVKQWLNHLGAMISVGEREQTKFHDNHGYTWHYLISHMSHWILGTVYKRMLVESPIRGTGAALFVFRSAMWHWPQHEFWKVVIQMNPNDRIQTYAFQTNHSFHLTKT